MDYFSNAVPESEGADESVSSTKEEYESSNTTREGAEYQTESYQLEDLFSNATD